MTSLRLSLTAQPLPTKDSKGPSVSSADSPETPPEPYRLRLHFGSPNRTRNEGRVFDVAVQGQSVIENVKVGGEAGMVSIHTIDRVMLGDWLEITFTEKKGHAVLSGIELQRLEE